MDPVVHMKKIVVDTIYLIAAYAMTTRARARNGMLFFDHIALEIEPLITIPRRNDRSG